MLKRIPFLYFVLLMLILSGCFSSRNAPSSDYRRIKKTDTRTDENANKGEKRDDNRNNTNGEVKKYSSKLGIELSGKENPKLLDEIAKWMGTPYLTGGCSFSGTDCSCLIHTLYQTVYGINLERSSEAMAQKNCLRIDKDDLREGDLIFFSIKNVKISHVGLYISNGNFVHSTTSKGVIISNIDEPYYQKYYTHSGRVKN